MATIHSTAQDWNFNEVEYAPSQTTFRLFAPQNAKVSAQYGKDAENPLDGAWKTVKMKPAGNGLFEAVVKKDLNHHAYRFCVNGLRSNGVFAKAVFANGEAAQVLDMTETNPEGWEDDRRPATASPADLVIYEMHHRDFSVDASSEIRNKGKFLALTEPKAICHLAELGVNAVHILPSYDFGSVDEKHLDRAQYNWGYDPVNYNVPEGSYSTDPAIPAVRIREFKQMVQSLHKAGIRVILDVVFNHTYDIENSNFQKTFPDYYYRKQDGKYSNGSGCGNETASEQPMMRRFMVESVKYWIREYHINGFRFDLMGCHDIATMNAIREAVDEIDPTIFIYGEGWSAGACALPQQELASKANIPQMPRIAAFSDEFRDALRGPFSDDAKGGFLAGIPGQEESLKFGIAGCIRHPQVDMQQVNYSHEAWAVEPTQMISYVSCHDDMCLVDRLKASVPDITTEEIVRLDLLAQTAVFTSQGVPFLLSGEEMLRDKKGVHNSYNSPDSINVLNWRNLQKYPQVFQYYRNLICLRQHHPAFRLGSAELVRRHLEFLPGADNLVVFRLKDHAGGDVWKNIYVVLNANREAQTVSVPAGKYEVVCCDGTIDEAGITTTDGGEILVEPQSALIFHD